MNIEEIDASTHVDFAQHEKLVRCVDEASGLLAYIAIHNLNLGPALGGCRIWPYENEDAAIKDVLRLSKGMTYKSALANLPLGGGKAVIIANPKSQKTAALMRAMGVFVQSLSGSYITAEDSGTTVEDLKLMSTETEFVTGIQKKVLSNGQEVSGDPSPSTAYGVFVGIKASLKHRFGNDNLEGVKVAIQGVGNVGRNLAIMLVEAGATVMVSDMYQSALDRVCAETQVTVVPNDTISKLDVDVYSPCALGGAINMNSLVELNTPIIAGAANNQLLNEGAGEYLFHKGIVYAPDYVINAGGIIDIAYERKGYDHSAVIQHIDGIATTLEKIFAMSETQQRSTQIMADQLAESKFLQHQHIAVA